jgi:hypothetical protein
MSHLDVSKRVRDSTYVLLYDICAAIGFISQLSTALRISVSDHMILIVRAPRVRANEPPLICSLASC